MEALSHCTAGYRLRVYEYANGVVEAVSCFVPVPRKVAPVAYAPELLEQIEAARAVDNVRRAHARAKAAVRRLCLSAGVDRLLTLTYRENRTDLGDAWADLKRFIRRVRRAMPRWVYVAVAERQKRGAVHFHLGVKGWQNVVLLRNAWRQVVGADNGNIDVTRPRLDRSPAARSVSCSRYLAKYMTKLTATESGDHRYHASQIKLHFTVQRLECRNWIEAGDLALRAATSKGGTIGAVVYDEGYGLTWAIGWVATGSQPSG